MAYRYLFLAVSSPDALFKAENFLKLVKPPDGEDMTDLNIKLDWDKDTSNKWLVNDAKASMLTAGYDWVTRTGGPVTLTDFKVVFASSGDPVQEFDLLEQWMGPALSVGEAFVVRPGVFFANQDAGAAYDKWPVDGIGWTLNTVPWQTIMVQPPLSDSDYWWRTTIQKVNDTAAASNKVSLNGHGDSLWFQWEQAQDPDLDPGETIRLFKENANGDPFPIRRRMAFA